MFAIGEARSQVFNGKVAIPKEYRLKRRAVMGKWKNENILYLSDSISSLNYMAGRDGEIFMANIDAEDRLQVPIYYEKENVNIQGCISTIELKFQESERRN